MILEITLKENIPTIDVANTTLIADIPIDRNNKTKYSSKEFLPGNIGKAYANISNDPNGFCALGYRIPLETGTKYKANSGLHDNLPGMDKELSENSKLYVSLDDRGFVEISLGRFKAKDKENIIAYFGKVVENVKEKMENKELFFSMPIDFYNKYIKPEL